MVRQRQREERERERERERAFEWGLWNNKSYQLEFWVVFFLFCLFVLVFCSANERYFMVL